jgi:hypothetical protein
MIRELKLMHTKLDTERMRVISFAGSHRRSEIKLGYNLVVVYSPTERSFGIFPYRYCSSRGGDQTSPRVLKGTANGDL